MNKKNKLSFLNSYRTRLETHSLYVFFFYILFHVNTRYIQFSVTCEPSYETTLVTFQLNDFTISKSQIHKFYLTYSLFLVSQIVVTETSNE